MTCSRLTSPHSDTADVLLSQEVPDLHQSSRLLNDDVDGEMGVHRAHLVPETLQSDKRAREALSRNVKANKTKTSTNNKQPDRTETRTIKHINPSIKAGNRAYYSSDISTISLCQSLRQDQTN